VFFHKGLNSVIIRMMVAGQSLDGPDLYFCKLNVSEDQIENGLHYEYAVQHAKENGFYGEMVAFDEDDYPWPLGFLFVRYAKLWESAMVIDLTTLGTSGKRLIG
jgi:hypothetical protein